METYDFLKATLMGLLEGATEFLPVSSTGHLILLGDSVNFNRDISAVFEISIQTGAIFALLIFYKRELNERLKVNSSNLFYLLAISFVPIGLFGFLFGEFIMRVLFFPVPVAISFIFGGVAILLVEKKIKGKKDFAISDLSEVSNVDALKVGLVQALSLFPGMSRSGAAIVGGMYFGFSRSVATEFSFLLAVPVIVIAGAYSVFLDFQAIKISNIPIFVVGFLSSFLSALIVVKWFLVYVKRRTLKIFGYYRIIVGGIILALFI